MASSRIAARRLRPIGSLLSLPDLRCRLALALLGTGAASRRKLAEHLHKSGAYKGPVFSLKDRTLVACGDHAMWVLGDDNGVGRGLLKHGAWQRDDFDTALALIAQHRGRPGGVFVDVGANIGTHSIYAALSGRFDRVIAIEPEPRNAALIRDNVSMNDLPVRFDIVRKAVGEAPSAAWLKVHPADGGMHAVVRQPGAGTIGVEQDTLPNILASLGVAAEEVGFIWMDVEGHEFKVFEGMESLLLRRTPVFFEYSQHGIGDERHRWAEKFAALGYGCWLMKHGGRAHKASFDEALGIAFGNMLLL
jgi:FkbM family methyltransferase